MNKEFIVYTFGHSTQSLSDFIDVLKKYMITELIDIRTVPRSRYNPQFNKETLPLELAKEKIEYRHFIKLGGLRHVVKNSINTGWENDSFRGYADYMQTKDFENAVEELLPIIKQKTVVLVCAEGLWWRCHRRMVADALSIRGIKVLHILPNGKTALHELTSFAKIVGDKIYYPKN